MTDIYAAERLAVRVLDDDRWQPVVHDLAKAVLAMAEALREAYPSESAGYGRLTRSDLARHGLTDTGQGGSQE